MRKSWEKYFMDIATKVAERSTCDRASVGAVLVKNNKIIAAGYNGSPSGEPHCTEVGHLLINGHCKRTIHAEVNAILQTTENMSEAILYVTHYPCIDCQKIIKQVGISKVYYKNSYGITENCFDLNIERIEE